MFSTFESKQLKESKQEQQGALHIILIGVAGTIYNEYTIKLLVNLGLSKVLLQNGLTIEVPCKCKRIFNEVLALHLS